MTTSSNPTKFRGTDPIAAPQHPTQLRDDDAAEPGDRIPRQDSTASADRLIPADRTENYNNRWNEVKGRFVDDPRQAVTEADALVCELLDELKELFGTHRSRVGGQEGDGDSADTEHLRLALRDYRCFFERLLAV